MPSISFDRAASYYDATRGLPPPVRDAVADVLSRELAGRRPVLEIGVGTGRIALPLVERGVDLVGIDLAAAMLERLRVNAAGQFPFPVMIGDVTRLPLADASVSAVLSSHVLHLISDWQDAVDEAWRVLRPGGSLLVDFGGGAPARWGRECDAIFRERGIIRVRPGVSRAELVAEYLGERATKRELEPVTVTAHRSLAEDLESWEEQIHSWTWPYSADQMRQACDEIRAVAGSRGWALEEKVVIGHAIRWWAFDRERDGPA